VRHVYAVCGTFMRTFCRASKCAIKGLREAARGE
jgi:hypothetical protein